MNYKIIGCLLIALTLFSCKPEENWSISFCTQMENDKCIEARDTFKGGVRIYVTLESKIPIQEKMIVGNIYRMLEGTYDDYLGTNHFNIESDTHSINHFIPFDEMGGAGPHLVEFTTEDGVLIASKELFIK